MFHQKRTLKSNWISLIPVIVNWISVLLIDGKEFPLTQIELKNRFGQEKTTFNDERSCYRVCDGQIRTCYYEFNVQFYDSMSALCGSCDNGTISDCFRSGCITANGMPRTVMTVNRQIPGPIISCCKNDRIIVDVTNNMSGQELTFHWHGLHQRDSPWFDGVPMVTQCPIAGGTSFRYIFNASEAGTHLYHAHSGLHRMNGLFGSLIVRESSDPNAHYYDYDLDEHTAILSDWNNAMVETTVPGTKIQIVMPDSILFNQFGSYFNNNNQTNQSIHTPMPVFYMERGKRHRFRISNVGGHFCPFEFNIADHNLTVIATDGFSIEPIVVERIISLSGERYDVILNAKNDLNLNETLITVRGLGLCKQYNYKIQEFARIIFVDDLKNHVRNVEDHRPLKKRPAFELQDILKITLNDPEMNCHNSSHYCVAALQQKQVPNPNGGNFRNQSAQVIKLNFEITYVWNRPNNYISSSHRAMISMINRISSTNTPVPGLLQDDSNVPYCNAENLPHKNDADIVTGDPVYYCPHQIQLQLGQLYEIVLVDSKSGIPGVSHSLHLHGNAFQVIDMGTLDEFENGRSAFANATHLPVVKDTITIPWKGFIRFRFRATNPGLWIFHCHLEFHFMTGMKIIFKVGNRTDILRPPANFPTCANFLTPVVL